MKYPINKSLVIFFFTAVSFFCSCQKELHFPDEPGVIDTIPKPDSPIVGLSDSYLPLTKDNFWKYRDSTTNLFDTVTVLGDTKTIRNKLYEILSSTLYQGAVFYAVEGHDYYTYQLLSGVEVEILFLNDAALIGDQWTTNMGIINGTEVSGLGTVVQKDINYTVEGKTYAHVIHSVFRLYYQIAGTTYSYGGFDYYSARGIGIIKRETRFGIDGSQQIYSDLKTLVDFSVK